MWEMGYDPVRFSCQTEFDERAIRRMFKTEYYTYEKKLLLGRCVFAVILLGVGMFSDFPMPARLFCLLIGVWLIVALDFPSKVRAEGVLQQRGGAVTRVRLAFTDREIVVEQRQHIPYAQLDRLVEDDEAFYLFQSRQNAVMADKQSLQPAEPEAFRSLIEKKTGKTFSRSVNLLSMNLSDLLRMMPGGKRPGRGKKRKP